MHKLFSRVRRLPGRTPVSTSRLSRSLKSAIPVVASAALAGIVLVGSSPDVFALPDSDVQALLNAHNSYRSKHCVPNLTWSPQLAAEAQQWADACPSNGFKHSPGAWQGENGYGENLSWGTNQSAKGAVDSWYSEIGKYNFSAPIYSNAVGHFTQVIWRNSKQLGCGMASCQGMNYWVCRYAPTGNWNTDKPGVLANNVPAVCTAGGGGGGGAGGGAPPAGGGGTPAGGGSQAPQNQGGEWAAFASNGKGGWGYAVGKASEQQAKDLALSGCGGAGNGCKVFWTTKDKCVSYAESKTGGYWYAAGGGTSQDQARQKALQFCQSGTAPPNSCKATGAWCR